jgi:dihydrofolate reductase
MVASLDGFVARQDGRVDWLDTPDHFSAGKAMEPEAVEAFLKSIDCYVMGSRTYEMALGFEDRGSGWPYGDTPTFVLTTRDLPRRRSTIEFYSGDLAELVNERLRPRFPSIWFVGGGIVCSECLRRGLADEIRYSIIPVLIGEGVPFFGNHGGDIPLHLVAVTPYRNGLVELHYEVQGSDTNPKRAGAGGDPRSPARTE